MPEQEEAFVPEEAQNEPRDLEAHFRNMQFDAAEVDKAMHDLALPTGGYTTTAGMVLSTSEFEDRAYAQIWGEVQGMIDIEGKLTEVKGRVGYRLSPERRNGTKWVDGVNTGEDSGKPDSASKLYAMAAKLFIKTYQQEPATPMDVFEFLRDYAHRVRLMATEDGRNIVLSISALR